MTQTSEFIPRRGFPPDARRIPQLLDRYLTPISIIVLVIGLALVIVGPVRTLLGNPATSSGNGGAFAPVQEPGSLAGGDLAILFGDNLLTRQLAPYTIIPDRPRNTVITYTVQRGDTLMGIAGLFGLARETIFWANGDILMGDVHMLRPDLDLFILPVDGVYHRSDEMLSIKRIADKYFVEPEVILTCEYNELEDKTADYVPPWGMRIIVPGGEGEFADWRPPLVETTDPTTGVTSTAFMPGQGGSCAAGIQGCCGSGAWVSPLDSYTFMEGFYPGHSGVDLAAPLGTPVVAADAGAVIFAGWSDWWYGNLVVLDHGNGWTTYYGHLSTVGVGCNQVVMRGEYIGTVGSTGNSSGPHLHFEMRWGHQPDNPANHIPF